MSLEDFSGGLGEWGGEGWEKLNSVQLKLSLVEIRMYLREKKCHIAECDEEFVLAVASWGGQKILGSGQTTDRCIYIQRDIPKICLNYA